jgi:hypothetical protein
MSEVNGDLIVFKVRVNGAGGSFKQIVCTDTVSFDISNDVSTKKTSCGPKTQLTDPTFSASGSGVFENEPLVTQVSWDEIKEWQKSKTKLDFQFVNTDAAAGLTEGEAVSVTGSGYFTSSTFTGSSEDGFSTFDFTFTGTGTIDSYDA